MYYTSVAWTSLFPTLRFFPLEITPGGLTRLGHEFQGGVKLISCLVFKLRETIFPFIFFTSCVIIIESTSHLTQPQTIDIYGMISVHLWTTL